MVKKILLPLLGVAAFIVAVGIFTQKSSTLDWGKYLQGGSTSQEKTMTVGSKTIQVEIANTEATREKGLGGVSSLPADHGMLFVFDSKPTNATFWMKGMLIPLDMIWVSDNKVVSINKDIPISPQGTPNSSLPTYSPNIPIDYVLEVNAGFSEQNNITVGSPVVLPSTL
jgi:uncharacterized membrane protein (UPF0127 family)